MKMGWRMRVNGLLVAFLPDGLDSARLVQPPGALARIGGDQRTVQCLCKDTRQNGEAIVRRPFRSGGDAITPSEELATRTRIPEGSNREVAKFSFDERKVLGIVFPGTRSEPGIIGRLLERPEGAIQRIVGLWPVPEVVVRRDISLVKCGRAD